MQWSNELSSGVDLIDTQHKELINRINGLLDAMKQGKGKNEVIKTVSFLSDYVVSHFGEEEKYMTAYRYPETVAHKMAHKDFINDFTRLFKGIGGGQADSVTVIQVQSRICDWLVQHICKTDKALGNYLKTRL